MAQRNSSNNLTWVLAGVTLILVISTGLLLKQNLQQRENKKTVPSNISSTNVPSEDLSESGPGFGFLQNLGWVPCNQHFWSELRSQNGSIIATTSEKDMAGKLKALSLKDLVNWSCTAPNGDSLALVAKRPNGWGQTSNWYLILSHLGIEQARIPFQSRVSFQNTDDVPQCNLNFFELKGSVVETDTLPAQVKVDCTGTSLGKDNQFVSEHQSFLIDLFTKKVSEVK